MALLSYRTRWFTRWATDAPVQVGIAAASWSIAGSFARSLLPRNPVQQAVASGIVAATHYQLAATSWASLQAISAKPGERPGLRASLTVAGLGIAGGVAVTAAATRSDDDFLPAALAASAGRITAFAALAGGASAAWDDVLHRRLGLRPGLDTTLIPSVATGAAVVAGTVLNRRRRAAQYGIVAPDRRAVRGLSLGSGIQAGAIGLAAGIGFAAATTGEQLIARGLERGMERLIGRPPGALGSLIAHGAILGALTAGGAAALTAITQRVQHRDDIVEPAYPTPPTSPHVSAGPTSRMPFDSLGKEGRRFVLMALSASDITAVTSEPAIDPVRVVGGYESSDDIAERAALTLQDMHDCGAFDRSIICIGVPTGVGYFNYSIAEALEYLTGGDCAIVVPQYALVPSALALNRTRQAEELTTTLLTGIREHLATLPETARPRVILIGESLGADIGLDLAVDGAGRPWVPAYAALGVDAGLTLGVPFLTSLWNAWREDPASVDPDGLLALVSQPDEIDPPTGSRHLMVVHHDDPVNKYGFRMIVQPPWWMGPPPSRPPLVPREVKFRPITTFILGTIDLFNGMQSKPGTFVRRGHDYRIDIRLGLERAFGFTSTPEQAEAIEAALRAREQEWATRRMIARKLDRARRSIERQLAEWGSPLDGADLDPTAPAPAGLGRLGLITAPPGA